jgi:hypothetical protein
VGKPSPSLLEYRSDATRIEIENGRIPSMRSCKSLDLRLPFRASEVWPAMFYLILKNNPQQIAVAQPMTRQGDTIVARDDFASAILSFQLAWQRASRR